jgi:hypothetical protein
MLFAPLSEAIVLFAVPAVFWHVMLLQYAGGANPRRMVIIGTLILLWTLYAWLAVQTGFDRALVGGFPGLPLLYILLAAFLGWRFSDVLLGRRVPQQMLIALQLFRPLGMVFFYEYLRGTLPGSFAIPAGWGDLLAGLTAAAVLIRYPSGLVPRKAVLLVATIGLLDFTSAVFFGFTSSATPVQLFAFDQPNQVLQWPLGLIPVFLVPYAVVAHVLSLAQLRRDRLTTAIG